MIIECTPMPCTVTDEYRTVEIFEGEEIKSVNPEFKGELRAYGVIPIVKPDGSYFLSRVSFVLHTEDRTLLPYDSLNVKID